MPVLKPPVSKTDHIKGPDSATVEIVEYGDFQCSYCGVAYPVIQQIEEDFGNQIRFVFRNFPLTQVHPYAAIAAYAAEAAGLQGKYWEMHNLIYENQRQLDGDFLYRLANKIGLNRNQFEQDMQGETVQEKVNADFESGMRSGVNGTPTFFVNAQKFDGGAPNLYVMLKESVE
jgi:protein-disulfide isomerase